MHINSTEHFMDFLITKLGRLRLKHKGKYYDQICPFTTYTNDIPMCGCHCPHFDEPKLLRDIFEIGVSVFELTLCFNTKHVGEFDDQRD